MKVLVFTTLFPNNIWPHHGVFIKERMSAVARLNQCDVRVIAPVPYHPRLRLSWRWRYSQVAREELIEGMKVYHPRYCLIPKIGMVFHGLMMFLSVVGFVKRLQREFDFDAIDAHYVYPDGFAAVILGMVLHKPVVVSARGSDINLFPKFSRIRTFVRYSLRNASRIIAVCQALKDAMVELDIPADKIELIPNGVDAKKFFPFSKQEARQRLNIAPDKSVILSVGGLIPRKSFDLIIKALKQLIDVYGQKNAYLAIVGSGPDERQLKDLVASLNLTANVLFVGAVAHGQLYLWYNAADVFCLASSREGWPNVLLESLACGTPVVASNIWGVPEIVRSDRIGLLTNRDEGDIAGTLSAALQKPWNPDELVNYARGHTWDHAARAVFGVFESVLEQNTGASEIGVSSRASAAHGRKE